MCPVIFIYNIILYCLYSQDNQRGIFFDAHLTIFVKVNNSNIFSFLIVFRINMIQSDLNDFFKELCATKDGEPTAGGDQRRLIGASRTPPGTKVISSDI